MATAKSNSTREIGVGVIGLGWMGRVHLDAYASAARAGQRCRVVAVSDRNPDHARDLSAGACNVTTGSGNLPTAAGNAPSGTGASRASFDPALVRTGIDPAHVLEDPHVELVSICTPTDTHVELALAALRGGKHVLVEKPVSLDAGEIERLDLGARAAGRLCMPAMCMRFWPGWSWLHDAVRDGRYGAVRSATFQRLGSRPAWGTDFYGDAKRSGGALFDLHVHDVDFVRWLFGDPASTVSSGSIDHVTTHYRFAHGPAHVVAEGGWVDSRGFPFRMRYVVAFESATAEFDSRRDPPLEITRSGAVEIPQLEPGTGWEHEVRHALECVRAGRTSAGVTLADAAAVTRILRAEEHAIHSQRRET
jgi:predicted dehydrogenase